MGGRGRKHPRALREQTIQAIEEAVQAGSRLQPACEIAGLSIRTYQRWKADAVGDDRRQGPRGAPKNKLTPQEQERVLNILNSPRFRELSPKQVVPRLADLGTYEASESTMYRLLRQRDQLVPRGRSRAPQHHKPKTLVASAPMQVLCWDITYLPASVRGQFFYWYVFEDLYSRAIVGHRVHAREESELSAMLLEELLVEHGVPRDTVTVHSDNGSPMKGSTMLATMERLGVVPSFSRPGVSNDNAYVESLFHTAKYCPEYPSSPFESLEAAQSWCTRFVTWYNQEHRHSALNFVTPQERFERRDGLILANRSKVYEAARQQHPERWSGSTRNWSAVGPTTLNPRTARS